MPGAMNIVDAAVPRPKQAMSELTDVINGPLAWSGDEFKSEEAYTLEIHTEELQEVDAALQSFKSKGYAETSFVEVNKRALLSFEYSSLP